MCHASNRRNCLAACLAQERADRCRQAFPNEISSSEGDQTDVTITAPGKASPHESRPRTAAIMDGKVVSRLLDQRGAPRKELRGSSRVKWVLSAPLSPSPRRAGSFLRAVPPGGSPSLFWVASLNRAHAAACA